jgi:phage baseplate assembly protein W
MAQNKQKNDFLGTDLKVLPFLAAQEAGQYDLATGRRGREESLDLATFAERENLAQALILRLLTPRGSLAALGHAAYGSRLYELIGQPKNQATRNLCRAFVLEVVAQEARVEPKAVRLDFDPASESPSNFVFTLLVQPVADGEPLSLSLELSI